MTEFKFSETEITDVGNDAVHIKVTLFAEMIVDRRHFERAREILTEDLIDRARTFPFEMK